MIYGALPQLVAGEEPDDRSRLKRDEMAPQCREFESLMPTFKPQHRSPRDIEE